jgi:peptidyl-prolyl cis-trans isomerase C
MTRAYVWMLTVRPLREPFVHFLVLGAVLFGLYALLQPKHAASGDSRQVILMRGDIDHLRLGFAAQWRRSPSAAEMQALLNDRINEEVLYREGLALGLDRDDTVVRRRLAQKTQFLLQDVAGLREPTAEDLARYRSQNAHRYSQGPRWTFEHIYFSTASRHERAELDAREALSRLRNAPDEVRRKTLGDPSLLDLRQTAQSQTHLRDLFGPDFASAVSTASALSLGAWAGPFRSSYGWHLVRLEACSEPPGEDAADLDRRLRADWAEEQQRELNAQAMARLRARYSVVVNDTPKP